MDVLELISSSRDTFKLTRRKALWRHSAGSWFSQSIPEDTHVPFTDRDKRLAAAIAKTLNFWGDLFHGTMLCRLSGESEKLKGDTLRMLFNINERGELEEAEIEFEALLSKLFVRADSIQIKKGVFRLFRRRCSRRSERRRSGSYSQVCDETKW